MKKEIDGDDINNEQLQQQEGDDELRRGPWTLDEDNLLTHYVACHGEGRWNLLAKSAGLKRTGKSCRLRWLNYLKPDIKRGNLSPQEQLLILELHSKWGNRWSKIAAHLPGRTDNEIKNYWRTRVQKQAKQLNMESNSQSFIDAIRCFYMPRLIQKIEQSSTSSPTLYSDASASSSTSQMTHLLSSNQFAEMNLDNSLDNSCSNISLSSISEIPDFPSSATSAYDMDLASMSTAEVPFTDCHVGWPAWPGVDDMADDSFWDLDELWQFRK